ncbi:MAG TPA: tetratricopeptide repeat protein [Gemmataceae bacterium]|nr:tetratricopeptide repeat protein [Gemmataceae bacterium]
MPTNTEMLDLAVRFLQSGDPQQAEALCRRILQADPAHTGALQTLGLIARQTGNLQAAAALMRRAIDLNPAEYGSHFNLGLVLKEQGLVAEAEACFRQAVRLNPRFADGFNNLGLTLKDQGKLDEAVACFRQSVRLNPRYVAGLNNLGLALNDQEQFAEALTCFRQALAENPRHIDARNNLGGSLTSLGLRVEAREHYEEALRVQPGNGTALWNRSLLRLLEGDFEGGWPDYEHRWTQPGFVARHLDRPLWDGSALEGKTILLHAEQGLGDTIQFLRYAALVKRRGGTVLFECQPSLVPLCTGIAGIDHLLAAGAAPPPYDVQAPLLSLPRIFGTTSTTIPTAVPYLRADPGLVAYWKQYLTPLGGCKIGIAWQGSLAHKGDRFRSFRLKHLESLAEVEGVRLVSLQKGPGTDQLRGQFPILDLSERLDVAGAFLDTAAIMMNLDLVITVDSAVAHLAGALAVPVWVALSSAADWRWLLERAGSPWYPTMRLFRQQRIGEWHEVFERITMELCARLRINPQHAAPRNNLAWALNDLGILHKEQGRLDDAGGCFRQALDNDPSLAYAHHNLGGVLNELGELAEAAECFRRALRIHPRLAPAHTGLGLTLMQMGLFSEALDHHEEALRIHPGNGRALWNRSLLRLLTGDFEAGWKDYEERLPILEKNPRMFQQPRWDGSALAGKTILVYAEQGLGDTIQFARYLSLVKERGGTVVFECQSPLSRLCGGVPGVDQIIVRGEVLPHFDVHAALLSLPGIFGTTLATIPAAVPYLRADPEKIEHWRRELGALPDFKIGIAWQGDPKNTKDRSRSCPLTRFATLAGIEGVRLLSLQVGPGTEQLAAVAFPISDLGSRFDTSSMDDLAAVLMNLDLVITVDTAVAHLAGALGVRVWTLLTLTPDWRWLLERVDCPWYPTMRLFRQRRYGDWGELLERVNEELRALLAK